MYFSTNKGTREQSGMGGWMGGGREGWRVMHECQKGTKSGESGGMN